MLRARRRRGGRVAPPRTRRSRPRHRVFVLERADTMNDEAANTLLKTLEEPPAYVVLLLLTDRPDAGAADDRRPLPARALRPAAAPTQLAQRLQRAASRRTTALGVRAARAGRRRARAGARRSATGPALRAARRGVRARAAARRDRAEQPVAAAARGRARARAPRPREQLEARARRGARSTCPRRSTSGATTEYDRARPARRAPRATRRRSTTRSSSPASGTATSPASPPARPSSPTTPTAPTELAAGRRTAARRRAARGASSWSTTRARGWRSTSARSWRSRRSPTGSSSCSAHDRGPRPRRATPPCARPGSRTRSRSRSRWRSASTAAPLAVTMRTPGHDEELALGFLYGEGLIDGPRAAGPPADLAANTVEVAGPLLREPAARSFYTTSSCGVCGKGALEEVAVHAEPLPDGPVRRPRAARRRCPTGCASRRSSAPAACTPPGCSRRTASCCACARTSAATTRWTR